MTAGRLAREFPPTQTSRCIVSGWRKGHSNPTFSSYTLGTT
jgi:hypothetical protein